MLKNNQLVPMTRRYPNLKQKVLRRDAEIAKRLIKAWDEEKDAQRVLEIFLKEQKNLSDERYWELLRTVWIVAGSVKEAPLFRKLFLSQRKQRFYFSTPEEQARLRSLPEPFTVYRATNDEKDEGLSWTLSEGYANEYARMYEKEQIMVKRVTRAEVFALIERNKEEEILIL